MYEYIGIYDEEWTVLHSVKIKADNREQADLKFEKYLEDRLNTVFVKEKMIVIPLFALEVIE